MMSGIQTNSVHQIVMYIWIKKKICFIHDYAIHERMNIIPHLALNGTEL